MGNLVLLLGLVLIMGSSTSASNALSSSSFTTNNGKMAFTKHNGYSHFQSKNGKSYGETNHKNGETAHVNGNGHPANGVNGKDLKNSNGVHAAFVPRNGKSKPDPIVEADYIADTKLPTDVGQFQLRAYRVKNVPGPNGDYEEPEPYQNTNALEPVVIYSADKPPFGEDGLLAENVPIRIHDQCLTSEVFRSQRYVLSAINDCSLRFASMQSHKRNS
jgi:GTP cyclohydrolase II